MFQAKGCFENIKPTKNIIENSIDNSKIDEPDDHNNDNNDSDDVIQGPPDLNNDIVNSPRESNSNEKKNNNSSNNNSKIIETKESIISYDGNKTYFIDSHINALDNDAAKLLEFKKINKTELNNLNDVSKLKKTIGKNYYALCIANDLSLSKKKRNILATLQTLRNLLLRDKQKEIGFSKNETINSFDWSDILNFINEVYSDTPIKILICTGKLTYVNLDKRDDILNEYHKSPIGGHRGVSKTYARIKNEYHWEGLKDDI